MAFRIAAHVHAGQTDKAGAAYISHPARVAARLIDLGHRDEIVAAGLLHDVVEDTGITLDQLAKLGFPREVVLIVDALTRRPGEHVDSYYSRIREYPSAVIVKDADIHDNSDPDRLNQLRLLGHGELADRLEGKYVKALAAIHQ